MTRNRSSRGRQRRGRNRAEDALNPEQTGNVEAAATRQEPEAEPAAHPPRPASDPADAAAPDAPRPVRPTSRGPQRGGPAGSGDGMPRGGQNRNRRRTQRRNQITAMPGDVLKPRAPVSTRSGPLATHTLEEISSTGEPVFGCPMLTRTRLALPVTGGSAAPRCCLGWALHSETEASYCLETPDLVQCWKAHPERLEEIRARLTEAATAAD